MSNPKIGELVNAWSRTYRDAGCRIVMTSGCFDILHPGHIRFLQDAKSIGDKLVVSVATTTSHKGNGRPFYTVEDRCLMLAALECVDFVTMHQTDKLVHKISDVHPHIYVKGGDYGGQQLPEAEAVRKVGGVLAILPFHGRYSTTNLIECIKKPS